MSPASESNDGSGPGLYRRLVWLTVVRIALVTLLLSASAAVALKAGTREELGVVEQSLYAVIVSTYLASLGYLLILRRSPRLHTRLAYAQIAGDALISGSLVYLTGGSESVIVFMFPLTVVSSTVLLHRRGAIFAAGLCAVGVAAVFLGLNAGFLPPASPALYRQVLPLPRLAFSLFANISAIFLTAALASFLAEQLRRAGEKLTLKELDYAALSHLHESIVRSINSGICSADRFGRITFLNPAAEEITGLRLAKVRWEPIEEHFPALVPHLPGTPLLGRVEAEHITPDGQKRRLGLAVAPLVEKDATRAGFVVTFQDLTAIRAMEEAVMRSEKLAAMGAMAAGLAHELRNPLASMSGSIQLLGDGKDLSFDERRLMDIVLREADRLNRLVTDFLQAARPSPPQIEAMDLGLVLNETLTLFRNGPARHGGSASGVVEVEALIAGDLLVEGDSAQLRQVLWNLLVNAAESMAGGGTVRVEAERAGGEVRVRVSDQGEGIPASQLPHIFDPFFTTKERGTGLGLSSVHAVVEGHGGRIEVSSEAGAGCTFTLIVPARAAAMARVANG